MRIFLSIMLGAIALAIMAFTLEPNTRAVKRKWERLMISPIATGLSHPWSLAFLPEGDLLVTERTGRLTILKSNGTVSPPIEGLPSIAVGGQGGLMDVLLAQDFVKSRVLYLSYSAPREDGRSATAVMSGRLAGNRLEDVRTVFVQDPPMDSSAHFGSRLAWGADGTLFISTGERFISRDAAQGLDNMLGKVVRLDAATGKAPPDNPFVGFAGTRPEIFTYGHRNSQGLALNPITHEMWELEHGPDGGDELNILKSGRNYGWPVLSFGKNYDGSPVGSSQTARPDMESPIRHWTPSIAPSGLTFYTSDRIPGWKGSVLLGSLKLGVLVRLELDGDRVVDQYGYDIGFRIRDVRQAPDGTVYLLGDENDGVIVQVDTDVRKTARAPWQ